MGKGGDAEVPAAFLYIFLIVLVGVVFYLWWWRPAHIDHGRIPPVPTQSVTVTPSSK